MTYGGGFLQSWIAPATMGNSSRRASTTGPAPFGGADSSKFSCIARNNFRAFLCPTTAGATTINERKNSSTIVCIPFPLQMAKGEANKRYLRDAIRSSRNILACVFRDAAGSAFSLCRQLLCQAAIYDFDQVVLARSS